MSVNLEAGLRSGVQALGLVLTDAQIQHLLDYAALIQKWNKVYNLTALRDPADMLTHHLLDSLTAIAPLRRHTQGQPIQVLDVGSGGGLPGVVLAICMPELNVSCVDTVAKKAAFVQQFFVYRYVAHLRVLPSPTRRPSDLEQMTWYGSVRDSTRACRPRKLGNFRLTATC